MNYNVKVNNPCRCFLRSGFNEVSQFDSEEKAKEEAEYMLKIMKSNFCQKHKFTLENRAGDFEITIKPNS
ncbi:MAG: hypothetical protein U9N42_01000 [Campylobacterota bacterium]|nr:hypothetical protein [Campylobacterota bacterium]